MTERKTWSLLSILVIVLLLTAGCGGGPTPEPAPPALPTRTAEAPTATSQPAPTATTESTATPAPSPTRAAASLQDVKRSVVRIEASGSFRYPEGVKLNSASGGTGFIIDPSGLAVTNNHVVTGAAMLKVYLAGESDFRHAKVIGVSECSDLALIQIEGKDFPALAWYESEVSPGLDVYAAGFPLGNPEFTLTHGIIAKAKANGKTNWASVPSVIEHDASLNPGNSGGPLVTKDGEVVGVNYAGASDTRQFYAIAHNEAEKVLAQLRQGKDVDAIGLNGEAFVSDDGKTSGIWTYSVKSGSPADKAGIKPGDIVTQLEGVVLATDGTMADYCDILRTHNSGDTLNVTVVRFDDGTILEGQINGRELKQTGTLPAQTSTGQDNQATTDNSGAAEEFVTLHDKTGTIAVQVPKSWSDVASGDWVEKDEVQGVQVSAAPDLDQWQNGFDTNGIFMGVSRTLAEQYDAGELLDAVNFKKECTYIERRYYNDKENGLNGYADMYKDCDGGKTQLIEIAATPDDQSYIMLIQVTALTDADVKTLDNVIYTIDADKLPAKSN